MVIRNSFFFKFHGVAWNRLENLALSELFMKNSEKNYTFTIFNEFHWYNIKYVDLLSRFDFVINL